MPNLAEMEKEPISSEVVAVLPESDKVVGVEDPDGVAVLAEKPKIVSEPKCESTLSTESPTQNESPLRIDNIVNEIVLDNDSDIEGDFLGFEN